MEERGDGKGELYTDKGEGWLELKKVWARERGGRGEIVKVERRREGTPAGRANSLC